VRMLVRLIALVCAVAVIGPAGALWWATGRAVFTQLPSESLARMQGSKPADDPFAGLGMNDLAGEPKKVDNSFRFGLLPAGPGHGFADSASVLMFAGPALVLLVCAWGSKRRRNPRPAS